MGKGKRRPSPTPEDIDRIQEILYNLDGGKIDDENDFDAVFDDYFGDEPTLKNDNNFRNSVLQKMEQMHPQIITGGGSVKGKKVKPPKSKHKFTFVGRVGRKVVYLRPDNVSRNGKKFGVYRDRYGRFGRIPAPASRKIKK